MKFHWLTIEVKHVTILIVLGRIEIAIAPAIAIAIGNILIVLGRIEIY